MTPSPDAKVKRSTISDDTLDELLDMGIFLFLKLTDISDNSTTSFDLSYAALAKLQGLIPRLVNTDLWEAFQIFLDGSMFLLLVVLMCLYKGLTYRITYLKRFRGLQKIKLGRHIENVIWIKLEINISPD